MTYSEKREEFLERISDLKDNIKTLLNKPGSNNILRLNSNKISNKNVKSIMDRVNSLANDIEKTFDQFYKEFDTLMRKIKNRNSVKNIINRVYKPARLGGLFGRARQQIKMSQMDDTLTKLKQVIRANNQARENANKLKQSQEENRNLRVKLEETSRTLNNLKTRISNNKPVNDTPVNTLSQQNKITVGTILRNSSESLTNENKIILRRAVDNRQSLNQTNLNKVREILRNQTS